jgi:hypothetical protein
MHEGSFPIEASLTGVAGVDLAPSIGAKGQCAAAIRLGRRSRPYLIATTMESGPPRCVTLVCEKPASRIQP